MFCEMESNYKWIKNEYTFKKILISGKPPWYKRNKDFRTLSY